MNRPLPPIGSKVRFLRETSAVKPQPLKGRIATVTEHYPGYTFRDDGERIDVPDAFGADFGVPVGHSGPDGEATSLALHCDDNDWELV